MKIATRKSTRLYLAGAALLVAGCAERETVKFGVVLPLSGWAQVYGDSVRKGIDLAYEQLQNDNPSSYDIEIEILDSGSDPEEAARLADQLFGSSLAIIGGVTSAEAIAMGAEAREAARVFLSPTAASSHLTRIARTFFRVFPTTTQEGTVMANFVNETLNVKRLAVLLQHGPFGDDILEAFQGVFEKYGGEITGVVELPIDSEDYSEAIAQAFAGTPGAIYIAAEGHVVPELVKALRGAGYGTSPDAEGQQWILATSAFALPALIAEAGSAADNVYLTQSIFDIDSEDGAMPAFVEAYRAKYNEDPDLYSGHGYDSLMIFGAATTKIANTLASEFQKGIRQVGTFDGATGVLQFNEAGDVQKFPRIHWIEDGVPHDFQRELTQRRQAIEARVKELEARSRRLRQEALRN